MRSTIRRFIAALTGIVLLAGCGGGNETPTAGREILVLGVAGMAGDDDPSLTGIVQGVQLAVDQYNANPDSRYEIELQQLGTKASPGEGGATTGDITKTERLIGVIGPFNEADVTELGPVFEGAGMPFLVPPLTQTAIPQPGWRSFRRLVANDRQEGAVLGELATRKVEGSIVIVAEESAPGASFAAGAKEHLDAAGRAPARTEAIEPNQDLGNLGTSLVEGGPEVILYGGGGETGTALLDALRKANFSGLFVASHQLRDAHPGGLGAGVTSSSPGADASSLEAGTFADDFGIKFDSAPVPYALEAYEGAIMLLEAIEEVAGDPRDVTSFLQQNRNFLGDSKHYQFNDAGELSTALAWIYESIDGAWQLAGRSDLVAD